MSYDVPVDMRKYVHRVGRTARAGRAGDAWTLVEEQEVFHLFRSVEFHKAYVHSFPPQARYFKAMLREADHWDRVKRLRPAEKELALLLPHYEVCYLNLSSFRCAKWEIQPVGSRTIEGSVYQMINCLLQGNLTKSIVQMHLISQADL